MDVVRLGPYNNTDPTYLPDRMIENYTSLVWTERFLDPGEFIMKTPYVDEMLEVLPEMTLISHRHTSEVMLVESHLITKDALGNEELTIAGRSVDVMFEHRFIEGKYQKRRQMAREYAPPSAAGVLMWNAIDNLTDPPVDVTRARKDADPDGDQYVAGDPWPWNSKDALPNVAISDSTSGFTNDDKRRWWLTEGMLYPQLIKILKRGEVGIRTIRPPSAVTTADDRLRVRSQPNADFGEIIRTTQGTYSELRFDIFQGKDRSHEQSANARVIFNVIHDHFDETQHLYTVKDWKTVAEVMSSLNSRKDIYRAGQSGYSGWQRRALAFDAGSPDIPDKPDYPGKNASDAEQNKYERQFNRWKNERDDIVSKFKSDYEEDALRELNRFRKDSLFSGDISEEGLALYKYKRDYDLGDKVTLRGRRGAQEVATVVGYVRTEDAEGDRGFPELTIND